jgi:hypothetical protein
MVVVFAAVVAYLEVRFSVIRAVIRDEKRSGAAQELEQLTRECDELRE